MRRYLLVSTLIILALTSPSMARATNIIVTTNVDDNTVNGNCTLREAIIAANTDEVVDGCPAGSGADVITFAGNYTITLVGSQLPAITSEMTITGNGMAQTIIQAASAPQTVNFRVLEVTETTEVTLNNLTVRNGGCAGSAYPPHCLTSPPLGGGILNAGTLTLNATAVSGSWAHDSGGGIYSTGPLFIMNNSLIGGADVDTNGNQSYDGGGGGVFVQGSSLTINHSTISSNYAWNGDEDNIGEDGGGVFFDGTTLTIENDSVIGGAGVGNWDLGVRIDGGTAIVDHSTISGNYAGGLYNSGGTVTIRNNAQIGTVDAPNTVSGLYNASGMMTVTGSVVSGNHSYTDTFGGGITNRGTLLVENNTLIGGAGTGNTASSRGGGIYNIGTATLIGIAISGNSAPAGGGIFNEGSMTIQNSLIGGVGAGNIGDGGGIFNYGPGTLLVDSSTIIANRGSHGGGIHNQTGTTTVQNSLIVDNQAGYDGGGVYIYSGTVTISGSTIKGNTASAGGGLYSYRAANANLSGNCLVDNSYVSFVNNFVMLTAFGNWWGDPGGPNVGSADTTSGSWTTSPSLTSAPLDCKGGPFNLSAAGTSQTTIALSWLDGADGETNFLIQRSADGLAWSDLVSPPANTTTFSDTSLSCETTRYYRILAHFPGGDSAFTPPASAATSACAPIVSLSDTVLDFGPLPVGQTIGPSTITLTNTGSTTLNLTSITVSGDYAFDGSGTCPSGAGTLAAQAVCTIAITFSPLAAGDRPGDVSIASDAAGSPAHIALSGVGISIADLRVVKTAGNPTPGEGAGLTYTISVTNLGPDTATGVTLTDDLPSGLTYVSHSATSGTYNQTTGLWTIGTVANGASETLSITASVDAGTTGQSITNVTGALTMDPGIVDPNSGNDTASVTVNVTAVDLSLAKSVDEASPDPGQTVSFTLTAHNNSATTDATAVTITDTLPAGLTFAAGGSADCNPSGQVVTCDVGTLSAEASAVRTIRAIVDSGALDVTMVNTAHAAGAQPDLVSSNDDASASISVGHSDASPSTTSHDFGGVRSGQISASFAITLKNNGSASLHVSALDVTGEFSANNGCTAPVPSGGSCSFDVTFKPATPGDKTGSVTILSNAPGSPPVVMLAGKGLNALPPPVLKAPKNGAPIYKSTVKLGWKAVKGANGYHIQIDDDINFGSPIDGDSVKKPAFLTQPLDFGIYFWRVASKDALGQSIYSAPFSFEVTLNKLPKKGVTLKNGLVKFKWQAVKGASYQLQVYTNLADPAGSLAFPVWVTSKTSYPAPKTAPLPGGTTYYWRVSIDGGTTWTLPWSFNVP